jgi:hypothetical protein
MLTKRKSHHWMSLLLLPLLASTLALSGCARHYVIKLTSGREMTVIGKPKLKGNSYVYKDAKGDKYTLPIGRVSTIEPASMAREEAKANEFKPTGGPPPKHHWYWPF